ncbi:MAG: putative Fe-S oxidoreductase [Firmicutes bacterium]|nr:putative Fe-S oxidoreductase [Bacillota bacterium]
MPVNLPVTCPNRDGELGTGGCTFCGEKGAGFESLPSFMPVREQLEKNMGYIRGKYNAVKFIAYFQNFSNTYLEPAVLMEYLTDACIDDVVEIYVSTRPDCISDRHLDAVKKIQEDKRISVTFEIGLQTVNYHSLDKVNRGHSLAEFIDCVLRVKSFGFDVCSHVILDLPWDNMLDVIENAKINSALRVTQVKLHSLYIVKGTPMAEAFLRDEIRLVSMDGYIERVIAFLEYLSPEIVVQRLIGRAPEEETLLANWNTSWWKVRDMIEARMEERGTWQGKKSDYLGGKAVRKFLRE